MSSLEQTPSILQVEIDAATIGDNIVVTGEDDVKILVYSITFLTEGAVGVCFSHGTEAGVVPFFPLLAFGANTGWDKDSIQGQPIFVCDSGEAFLITLDGNVQVSGSVWYKKVRKQQ